MPFEIREYRDLCSRAMDELTRIADTFANQVREAGADERLQYQARTARGVADKARNVLADIIDERPSDCEPEKLLHGLTEYLAAGMECVMVYTYDSQAASESPYGLCQAAIDPVVTYVIAAEGGL